MGLVIDHLQSDHRVRVLRDFYDTRGHRHVTGDIGVIRRMDLDWPSQEIVIDWERNGKDERLIFSADAKEGPRSGAMRDYFAMEERVPRFEDSLEGRRQIKLAELKRDTPETPAEPVRQVANYSAAVTRIWALAARRKFTEADEQISLVLTAPDRNRNTLEDLATDLVGLAERYEPSDQEEIYRWLRERAIRLWYAWGSQATSGGEGTVMAEQIRKMEQRLPPRS
jgi:hypothetical protein